MSRPRRRTLGQPRRAVPISFSVQASEPRHWFCGPSQVMVRIALLVFALVSRFRSVTTTSTSDIMKTDPKAGRADALRRAMLAYMNAYPAFWGPSL